jgi:hypothetical protein
MSLLGERLLAVHDALEKAHLPHAFGGAIALAYCTEEPRGTRDLDVNVFVDLSRAGEVFEGLPSEVEWTAGDVEISEREGQRRVWWDDTPIDLFLDVHSFHRYMAGEVRFVPFEGQRIPVLGCTALGVLKALFNRTKDWADIEEMVAMDSVDIGEAVNWLERMIGREDRIVARMASLAADRGPTRPGRV